MHEQQPAANMQNGNKMAKPTVGIANGKISVISQDRAAAFWGHEAIGTSQGGDAIVGCSVRSRRLGELRVIFSEAPEPPTLANPRTRSDETHISSSANLTPSTYR